MTLIVFDLETTGLDSDKNGIISISAKVFNSNREVITSFDEECQPDNAEIDLGALKVNRYTLAKIDSLKTEESVLKDFCDFLLSLKFDGELVIVGHNPHFDISFIKSKLKKHNITGFDKAVSHRVVDTASLGRLLVMSGLIKDNKVSLKDLAIALQIPYDAEKHHSANYDVDLTAKVLFAIIDKVSQLTKG